MSENMTWADSCKEMVHKFYQLTLKIGENPSLLEEERDCGYPSMSSGKYKEGFQDNFNLYQHSIDFANELVKSKKSLEEKLDEIIKETRTLIRNELPLKVTTTFLNNCLRISDISNKFQFSTKELSLIKFDDKYSEDNSSIVLNWMHNVVDKYMN